MKKLDHPAVASGILIGFGPGEDPSTTHGIHQQAVRSSKGFPVKSPAVFSFFQSASLQLPRDLFLREPLGPFPPSLRFRPIHHRKHETISSTGYYHQKSSNFHPSFGSQSSAVIVCMGPFARSTPEPSPASISPSRRQMQNAMSRQVTLAVQENRILPQSPQDPLIIRPATRSRKDLFE